jgi:uncharacterized protein (TIGR03435 family)
MLPETFMKSLMRSIVVVVLVLAAGVAAQTPDLAGQWQGTLQPAPGKELRLVFVLAANAAGGGYTATLYSIDQGGGGISAATTVSGANVRLSVAPAGITFEGKLAADGNSIAGTFTQGPGSLPLTITRTNKETAWALPAPPKTMPADAPLTFEVATVKPSDPNRPGKLFTVKGRDVLTINTTLADLMTMAYGVHLRQITGAPSWMETDKYDVQGRPQVEGVPSQVQLRGLLKNLLADRFKLTVHNEKKDLPAYIITGGPRGQKLTQNTSNPNGLPGLFFKGLGNLNCTNATMTDLAGILQSAVLDRPVVDKTGIQGKYDFTLIWTPDESQFRSFGPVPPPPQNDPNPPPGLFTAIQEQLGLKLDPGTASVDVVVIDRVEKPSEN